MIDDLAVASAQPDLERGRTAIALRVKACKPDTQ